MMNTTKLITQITARYSADPEYLWKSSPDFAVFRHQNNRKWFAILMPIEAAKIGLESHEKIPVLNVKAKPEEIGSLRMIKGIYPAYHMNKEHWVSLNLAEIDEALLFELIDGSFDLTEKPNKQGENKKNIR